jgi:uncharacterized protein (DUF1697 family)
MRFAAFLRNCNLGRPGKPSAAQLVAAYEAAGALQVRSFIATGNVLFSAASAAEAEAIAAAAGKRLKRACGLDEPAFVRSLPYLAKLAATEPFAAAPRDIFEQCISFLPDGAGKTAVPFVTPRRDVEVLRFLPGEALSVIRLHGATPGPLNRQLERRLAAPTTSRNWSMVLRLLRSEGR